MAKDEKDFGQHVVHNVENMKKKFPSKLKKPKEFQKFYKKVIKKWDTNKSKKKAHSIIEKANR